MKVFGGTWSTSAAFVPGKSAKTKGSFDGTGSACLAFLPYTIGVGRGWRDLVVVRQQSAATDDNASLRTNEPSTRS